MRHKDIVESGNLKNAASGIRNVCSNLWTIPFSVSVWNTSQRKTRARVSLPSAVHFKEPLSYPLSCSQLSQLLLTHSLPSLRTCRSQLYPSNHQVGHPRDPETPAISKRSLALRRLCHGNNVLIRPATLTQPLRPDPCKNSFARSSSRLWQVHSKKLATVGCEVYVREH